MDHTQPVWFKLAKHRLSFYGHELCLELLQAELRNSQGNYLSKARGILSTAA